VSELTLDKAALQNYWCRFPSAVPARDSASIIDALSDLFM